MMRHRNTSLWLRPGMAVIACLLGVMGPQVNAARVEVAGALLVDLRCEDLAPSSAASQWPNRGTLGGVFTAVGTPVVEAVGGWDNVVKLDGTSAFVGPASPAGITGSGPRSIEVWAYNIAESKEECMVSWSHRGGPDGTNMTFNYGWKSFGAAGHWGDAADMPWQGFNNATGGSGGYPPLETWQYLVYTYDGATCRLYVNGDLNSSRAVALNTHAGNAMRVGAQGNNDGTPSTGEKNFTGAIAQVRIHNGVLTAAQIKTNAQIRMQTSGEAYNPSPKNGDADVPLRDLTLSWVPGESVGTHTVYFSEDRNAVANGTAPAVSVDVNSYDPGRLEFGRTYFWRVDEVKAAPDSTVFTGEVWSFTVEPLACKVTGITATASSSFNAGSGPQKTVDGSGLNATDQHDTTGSNMWLSAVSQQPPIWIQYQFDGVYKLHQMWVWNSNSPLESILGLGVKDAIIEYSTDGATWTTLANAPYFTQAPGTAGYAHNTTVDFGGVAAKFVKMTITSNWGSMPQYGLSEVRFFYIPVLARDPHPATGATDVVPDATLSWRAGREAAEHRVYLGTDPQALTLAGAAATNSYTPAGRLLGTRYYWRVDEVNTAEAIGVWTGNVWSFTTANFIVVDDMESYNDNISSGTTIYQTWMDGYGTTTNGSQVGYDAATNGTFGETKTVHGGRQSMPFKYNMTGSFPMSEATRTFAAAQDWTASGVKTLTLFFYGNTSDTAAGLYVKINSAKLSYGGDAANISKAQWTQWDVDLSPVPAATLKAVNSLTIGAASGAGSLLIDDIRLYRSAAPVTP